MPHFSIMNRNALEDVRAHDDSEDSDDDSDDVFDCIDKYESCKHIVEDNCRVSGWARKNCEKSCGLCKVSCGKHEAATCSECPQGNDATWCGGECTWLDGKCIA